MQHPCPPSNPLNTSQTPDLPSTPPPTPRLLQATLAATIRAAKEEGKFYEGVSDLPGQQVVPDGDPLVSGGCRGGAGWGWGAG